MVAVNDPLVGELPSLELCNDVIDRLELPIEREFQADAGGPRSDVIREREAAPSTGWCNRSVQRLEQGLGVGIRDREHRDLGEGWRVRTVDARRVFCRAGEGCERITWEKRHVTNRPSLHAAAHPICAVWIHISPTVPVILWVRVDDAADRALLGRHFRLDTAPGASVACDDDLSTDVDTERSSSR